MPKDDSILADERIARDAYHLIRMRLDRLEQNINKPAPIPPRPEELKKPKPPPEFIRNVVGSSSAAGSADFHIFRHIRRKEMQRLDYINQTAKMEELTEEYKKKREEIERRERELTAKKRAKRHRRKENVKRRKVVRRHGANDDSDEENEQETEETIRTDTVHADNERPRRREESERTSDGESSLSTVERSVSPATES